MLGERLNDGLSMLRVGASDGPALVYLPGLGEVADLAEEVPAVLARSATSIATGSGRTVHLICRPKDMPSGTSVVDLAAWHAVALRESFGEPVDVMGTSAGGVIALQLAVDHGDVLRRVVVSVAASRISDQGRRDLLHALELERAGRSSAWLSSGLVAHGPLRLLAAAAYWGGRRRRRTPGEIALIEAVQQWDVTGRLGEVTTPTLVIGGTHDPLVPVELAEATAHGIAGGRLELLQGRGHATLLDPRSMRAARAFLDEA